MKNFTFIAITFVLFIFISCGTTNQERADTEQLSEEVVITEERPLDTRDPNRSSFSMAQEQQVQNQQHIQDHPPQSQLIYQYNQNMYADLNMTDDQIRQFEERDRAYMKSTTDAQHANRDEMLRQRNENLRGVLNPSQYTKYQQWVINNPPGF